MNLNKEIRRAMKKYIEHYGCQNTRKVIRIFSEAYNTPKQRISGNLTAVKYNYKTHDIQTHIPNSFSVLYIPNS